MAFSEFKNRNCLITGGMGLIGTQLNESLVKLGANVFILDVKPHPNNLFPNTFYIQVDVSDIECLDFELNKLINTIDVHHIFNCLSLKPENSKDFYENFMEYNFELWDNILKVNTTAVAKVCSVVGKSMIKKNFGTILNFTSIYGSFMGADQRIYENISPMSRFNTPAIYPVSKGGLSALTKHLAVLWGRHNVRTNSISPGGIFNGQDSSFVTAYSNRIPMNRMADIQEIVNPAIFLSSDSASYINGHELFVDGGLHAW